MLNFIGALFSALFTLVKFFVSGIGAPAPLHESSRISHRDRDLLILQGRGQQVVFSKRSGTVEIEGNVLTRFDAIETIDVARYNAEEDSPDCWSVSLRVRVKGRPSSIMIGTIPAEVDASIMAAQVSTITGKQVRSL